MRHAREAALDLLEPLIEKIRGFAQLKEKKRGIFYRKGKSFLHFHEDPAGLFADVFIGAEDMRFRVSSEAEQAALIAKLEELFGEP